MDPVTNPESYAAGMTAMTIVIVIVGLVAALIPTIFIAVAVAKLFTKQREEVKGLSDTGEPASATIQHVRDTGSVVDGQPVMNFVLLVHRQAGGNPYQAETKGPVASLDIPRLTPGANVPVRVDPADPQRVALDVNALRAVPAVQHLQAAPQTGSQQMTYPSGSQQVGFQPSQQVAYPSGSQQVGLPSGSQQVGLPSGWQQVAHPAPQGAVSQRSGAAPSQQAGMQRTEAPAAQGRPCPLCDQIVPAGAAACPFCGKVV